MNAPNLLRVRQYIGTLVQHSGNQIVSLDAQCTCKNRTYNCKIRLFKVFMIVVPMGARDLEPTEIFLPLASLISKTLTSFELDTGVEILKLEVPSNSLAWRLEAFSSLIDSASRRTAELKTPSVSQIFDCHVVSFDSKRENEIKEYSLTVAAMLLKQGPASGSLPSLQCISYQDNRFNVYYKIDMNLNKTPHMVCLRKICLGDIVQAIFNLIADLLVFGLEIREFDPVEDICLDTEHFQFISMHKLHLPNAEMNLQSYLSMIVTTLVSWTARFHSVEDPKLDMVVDTIKKKPTIHFSTSSSRRDFLFHNTTKSFKSVNSKMFKDSLMTGHEDESPFEKSSHHESRLFRRQTLASKEETPELAGRYFVVPFQLIPSGQGLLDRTLPSARFGDRTVMHEVEEIRLEGIESLNDSSESAGVRRTVHSFFTKEVLSHDVNPDPDPGIVDKMVSAFKTTNTIKTLSSIRSLVFK